MTFISGATSTKSGNGQHTFIENIKLAVVERTTLVLIESNDAIAQSGDINMVGVVVWRNGCASLVPLTCGGGRASDEALRSVGKGELPRGGIESEGRDGEGGESKLHDGVGRVG